MSINRPPTKGQDLEEILRGYFWRAGYFVLRGVPFQIDGEDITDIDLWLYERPAASSRRRLIVDIKNKKSPKAAERIIWTRGLQSCIGVDGAIVATTDNRSSMRRLAKSLSIQMLDKDAISKISQSSKIDTNDRITLDEMNSTIRNIDNSRRTSEWRSKIAEARGSILIGMGVQSANINLAVSSFFATETATAQPGSLQAEYGLRLLYLSSALAAISLDFVLADQAFRSTDERKQIITNAIRFGQADTDATVPLFVAATNLARTYVDASAAKQIEYGFYGDADRIPAEIIAEYLSKFSRADTLFNIAREIERASGFTRLPGYDDLSVDAKSLLGVFLDFNGISRERIALAWPNSSSKQSTSKFDRHDFLDDEKRGV